MKKLMCTWVNSKVKSRLLSFCCPNEGTNLEFKLVTLRRHAEIADWITVYDREDII